MCVRVYVRACTSICVYVVVYMCRLFRYFVNLRLLVCKCDRV